MFLELVQLLETLEVNITNYEEEYGKKGKYLHVANSFPRKYYTNCSNSRTQQTVCDHMCMKISATLHENHYSFLTTAATCLKHSRLGSKNSFLFDPFSLICKMWSFIPKQVIHF